MFCKPIQDRRVSPATASKGSIYAAVQQDSMPTSRVLNGNSTTPGDRDTGGPRHDALPFNHRATPNSDDTSEPDAASNASFDFGTGVSGRSAVSSSGSNSIPSPWRDRAWHECIICCVVSTVLVVVVVEVNKKDDYFQRNVRQFLQSA